MGDLITIQKQLEALMTLYRDDKAAAEMRQQRLEMRFEELSLQVNSIPKKKTGEDEGESSKGSHENRHNNYVHNDNKENKNSPPNAPRLDFPSFDAKSDPLIWINRCDHFFRHHNTPAPQAISVASFHLDGEAQR